MYGAVLLLMLENLLVGLIKRTQQVHKLLMKVLYAFMQGTKLMHNDVSWRSVGWFLKLVHKFRCFADRASRYNPNNWPTQCTKSFFIISLLYSCTCFKHCCAHHQEVKLYYTASGIVTFCRWPLLTCARDGHLQVWWYHMLYNTILTSWWWTQ
jgi:hypothetical protein